MQEYLIWHNPAALKWLWLAPALAALAWYAQGLRDRALRAFLGEQHAAGAWRGHRRRRLLKGALLVAAFCLLVVAAARPRVGVEMQEVQRTGADVVLVMDASDSMLARDVRPSRLEAAKQAALTLVNALEGDRIGIVVFAGSAYVYSPLTTDLDAAGMFISSIERGAAPAPGTVIEDALTAAFRLLEASEGKHRVIVLFSDGECHGETQTDTVAQIGAAGVQVHTVVLGTAEGEPIPLPQDAVPEDRDVDAGFLPPFMAPRDSRPASRFKLDGEGDAVITRADPQLMADIARAGGGVFVASSPTGVNVDRVQRAIAQLDSAELGTYEFTQYAERFQWPLSFALALLLLDLLIAPAPPRRREEAR